jgi:hypothetical protein
MRKPNVSFPLGRATAGSVESAQGRWIVPCSRSVHSRELDGYEVAAEYSGATVDASFTFTMPAYPQRCANAQL